MVDAINGTSGIKPKDLTIDWNDCTANEVMEYKDEGQEVPEAILVWAQDMAKNQAAADEITYEMSMNNPEEMSVTNASGDLGTNLRAEMQQNGVPLASQAQEFINQSNEYSNSVTALEDEMETILSQSEAAVENVEEYSNNIISQIQILQAKQEGMQNNTTSLFGAFDAIQIENQIRELANLGITNIENQAQSVYSATNGIGSAIDTASATSSIGVQTINIGRELLNIGDYTLSGLAGKTITSGNNAINTAQTGSATFNQTKNDNSANEERVNETRNKISNSSGIFGITTERDETNETEEDVQQDAAENATRDNEPVNERAQEATAKFEQDRENNKEQAELDPTLADTSITTDPNEILKRKERRGLT